MTTWQRIGVGLAAWCALSAVLGPVVGRALRLAGQALNPGEVPQ